MIPSLLIMVREGFEAALVVALVLAYLRKVDRRGAAQPVWLGVGLAAALATVIGIVLHVTVGGLEGAARLRSFAAISLLAAVVLTWMVFWMRRQASEIKGDLERKVDAALDADRSRLALALVAFLAVLREGIEAALFLVAAATESQGGDVLAGAVLGLAAAALLGGAVYAGGRRLPMRTFFHVTGLVVIVFAAGLLARSVLFLQAAGDVGSFNDSLYDLTDYRALTQATEAGKLLSAMFGWDPRPSVEQVLVWAAYLVPVAALFVAGAQTGQRAVRRRTA
jgi:high-affinity iron transporter